MDSPLLLSSKERKEAPAILPAEELLPNKDRLKVNGGGNYVIWRVLSSILRVARADSRDDLDEIKRKI